MAKALLFEEDPALRSYIENFLRQSGHSVDLALHPDNLENIPDGIYNIVFIDLSSQYLTKQAASLLIKKIKALRTAPVVAGISSAQGDLNPDLDHFLVTPLKENDLVKVLQAGKDTVDLIALGKILGIEDTALLVKLYDRFFTALDYEITQMYDCAARGDNVTVKSYAHSIKGAAYNLRLPALAERAKQIEYEAVCEGGNCMGAIKNMEEECKNILHTYTMKYKS